MNGRLNDAIDKVNKSMLEVSDSELVTLRDKLAISVQEHFEYQTLQSEAFASGRIDFDQSQMIYLALGEHHTMPHGWSTDDLAIIVVVTFAIAELAKARIEAIV